MSIVGSIKTLKVNLGDKIRDKNLSSLTKSVSNHNEKFIKGQTLFKTESQKAFNKQTHLQDIAQRKISGSIKSSVANSESKWISETTKQKAKEELAKIPKVTKKDYVEVAPEVLSAVPNAAKATFGYQSSKQHFNAGSKAEDKMRNIQMQKMLEKDRKMKVIDGDKFYDAFETPKEIKDTQRVCNDTLGEKKFTQNYWDKVAKGKNTNPFSS